MTLLFGLLALAIAAQPPAPLDAVLTETLPRATPTERADLVRLVSTEGASLHEALSRRGSADPDTVTRWLSDRVQARLRSRHGAGLTTSTEQARREIIQFEAWQARSFVTSGVFPKRYFGFVDAQGDSAALELRVMRSVRASTDACNRWLEANEIPWRVTDQELVVTWIAEGGALLLTTQQAQADRVHPILGIGLDDIAHGFKELPGLVEEIDAAAGTQVANIPVWEDGRWSLRRYMTLEETVVGTAIMWVWEKRIADRKLRATGRSPMHELDADTQFIVGSLVYNSGILHNGARPGQVRRYALADHLAGLAEKYNGSRPYLPVQRPADNVSALLQLGGYPDQNTSWIALYHILQRYGGYDGLQRFSTAFDADGRLRWDRWQALEQRLAAPPTPEAPPHPTPAALPARPGGCACGAVDPGRGMPALVLIVGLARLRRRRVR